MNAKIAISVLCTTYNHKKYIRQCLDSILKQKTNFCYEIIVHDDASTDGTSSIINEYVDKYPNIIIPIIQEQNIYNDQTKNMVYDYVLPKVRGKYIARCEGDDFWINENKLQEQYDYMESHDKCSLVVHNAKILYEKSGTYAEYYINNEKRSDFNTADLLNGQVQFPFASMFYKTEFYYKHNNFVKANKMFDYALKFLLSVDGYIHYIDNEMSVYRKGAADSWTERISMNPSKYIEHLNTAIYTYKNLNEYSNYEYNSLIEKEILQREYKIQIMRRDIRAFLVKKYRPVIKSLTKKQIICDFLFIVCPMIYFKLMK